MMRGLFVTATDTGVGKTILSAALLAAMSAEGVDVRAHKPAVSGLDEPPGEWPPDHELLASVAGMTPEQVAPLRYGPAVSPHLAASLEGSPIDTRALADRARAAADGEVLVVEGIGGLLVPLADHYSVRELAVELGMPMLIAARSGLGTINHTLLTLRSARAAGLEVLSVVLTPWPQQPSSLELSNRETIAQLGEVAVTGLELVTGPQRSALAQAGGKLPWREWLARS
jgi:dethiobiotin synthetase